LDEDPWLRDKHQRRARCVTKGARRVREWGQRKRARVNRATAPLPHFHWRRYKGFWRGQFAEGADPGFTYDRGSVEVAITLTTPDEAHDEERRTIRRLRPRDNQVGQPELEDAPF
jgi:hypothetical protein